MPLRSAAARGSAFSAALISLPVAQDGRGGALDFGVHLGAVAGGARSLVAKDVGMPAHQLAVQVVEHIGDGEMALVGRHLRIEQHLQQQIAELLGQVRRSRGARWRRRPRRPLPACICGWNRRIARGPRGSRRERAGGP